MCASGEVKIASQLAWSALGAARAVEPAAATSPRSALPRSQRWSATCTDRPIRCISLMGEVGQAPLRARRARARTRCSTTGLAAPQGQLSARRGRVPGRASPERRGSSPRMCSRGSAKPSWTRRNDRGQRRGPSHARGDALPLRDRHEPRRHHEAGGPLAGQLLANYWTPRDVQDGTRRNKYPT